MAGTPTVPGVEEQTFFMSSLGGEAPEAHIGEM